MNCPILHHILRLCLLALLLPAITAAPIHAAQPDAADPLVIGSRLELMVDHHLIDQLHGHAQLKLHQPQPRETVMDFDKPWEGNTSGYCSVIRDGDLYRMWYRGWAYNIQPDKFNQAHSAVLCYAQSDDGIHWTRPSLGLHTYRGSNDNNIIMLSGKRGDLDLSINTFTVFKDENPNCPPDARYKGFCLVRPPRGLMPFSSPDGLRWTAMADKPVITGDAFDSPNLAFWDSLRNQYRIYFRSVSSGESGNGGTRGIKTATSKDFLHWTPGLPLEFPDAPVEQLYTNQVAPYYRAPHLFIGLPARYLDRGWSDSMRALPDPQHRLRRASGLPRAATALTDTLLMTSRDGLSFHRWPEAFLRPGPQRTGSWNYGHQFVAWHLLETASALPDAPNELSLYAVENYWTGNGSSLRRYTLRIDGFVSLSAPMRGGEMITRPFLFTGQKLLLNFSTSAAGAIAVEIQDPSGKPLPGFALDDCPPIFGDALDRPVTWTTNPNLAALAGRPVRLRFVLNDADLYALRFDDSPPQP